MVRFEFFRFEHLTQLVPLKKCLAAPLLRYCCFNDKDARSSVCAGGGGCRAIVIANQVLVFLRINSTFRGIRQFAWYALRSVARILNTAVDSVGLLESLKPQGWPRSFPYHLQMRVIATSWRCPQLHTRAVPSTTAGQLLLSSTHPTATASTNKKPLQWHRFNDFALILPLQWYPSNDTLRVNRSNDIPLIMFLQWYRSNRTSPILFLQ